MFYSIPMLENYHTKMHYFFNLLCPEPTSQGIMQNDCLKKSYIRALSYHLF